MNGCENVLNVLEGKEIYITGSRHLDNEALACFLAKATGARCEAVSFEQMEALSGRIEPPESRLFLFDALDRRIQAMIVDKLPGAKGNGFLLSGLFPGFSKNTPMGVLPARKKPPAVPAAFSIAAIRRISFSWPSGICCSIGDPCRRGRRHTTCERGTVTLM